MNEILLGNNGIVIFHVVIFILLLLGFFYWFSTQKKSGDAAGSGLEAGFTYIYGIVILVVIALILSIVHFYLIKEVTITWIRYFAFFPMALMIIIPIYFLLSKRAK